MTDYVGLARRARHARAPSLGACVRDDASVDWAGLEALLPQACADMRACMQDPVFHAEGDVLTHTKMVMDALHADKDFARMDSKTQRALVFAVIFHDIEKPATRKVEYDASLGRERIRHPHHAAKGARASFRHLWLDGLDLETRLTVFHIIAWHQKVFHVFDARDQRAQIIRFSHLDAWRNLITFGRADNRGRISPNVEDTELTFDLLSEAVREDGLWETPFAFASEAARAHFFEKHGRSEHSAPPEPQGSRVIVTCGLPGVGKTTYAQSLGADWDVISFDAERQRLRLAPDELGAAVVAAFDRAREALRRKRAFVWANTNMTRLARQKIIALARDYDAHVEIACFDTPLATLVARNDQRRAPVPDDAINAMIEKFEPPTIEEAHRLNWISSH